jgi:hypothetical protein
MLTDREKRIVEIHANEERTPVEDFEFEQLNRKASRKWKIVNGMRIWAYILTSYLMVVAVFKIEIVVSGVLIWAPLISILWGGPAAYANIGLVTEKNKNSEGV